MYEFRIVVIPGIESFLNQVIDGVPILVEGIVYYRREQLFEPFYRLGQTVTTGYVRPTINEHEGDLLRPQLES